MRGWNIDIALQELRQMHVVHGESQQRVVRQLAACRVSPIINQSAYDQHTVSRRIGNPFVLESKPTAPLAPLREGRGSSLLRRLERRG